MNINYNLAKHYYFIFILGIICLAIVLGGIAITGSPLKQKELNYDTVRTSDFNSIATKIEAYAKQQGKLPEALSQIQAETNTKDPKTGKEYVYKVITLTKWSLCTEFSGEYVNQNIYPTGKSLDFLNKSHHKGYDCIEYDIPYSSIRPESFVSDRPFKRLTVIGWKNLVTRMQEGTTIPEQTDMNASVIHKNGENGQGLYFDGNTFIDMPESEEIKLLPKGDFTVIVWTKVVGLGNHILLATTNDDDGGLSLIVGGSGEIYCRTSNGTGYTDSITAADYGYVSDNKWHQLAIVKNQSRCDVYVDGVNRTQVHGNHASAKASIYNLTLGGRPNHHNDTFSGYLDNVTLFNYALSPDELASFY